MRSLRLCTLLLPALLACGSNSESGPSLLTLKNDGYTTGTLTFTGAFATGEAAASVFPARSRSYTIQRVLLAFGGSSLTETVTLTLYSLDTPLEAGVVLDSGDFQLTGSDNALQTIDLTGSGITVPAGKKLRVAFTFNHNGFPGPAADGDGIVAQRNLIYTSNAWQLGESLGLQGDWIIRVDIKG